MSFIDVDPISVPHKFSRVQDIEISAFFSAILAWGNRKTIVNKCNELMAYFDNDPYDFLLNHSDSDRKAIMHFKHRTFQGDDLEYFMRRLQRYYKNHATLETAFKPKNSTIYKQKEALIRFYNLFFDGDDLLPRTRKHIATPIKNSTCKRLNMFLRWMVRKDDCGVDFGIWKTIPPSELMIPLDIHVENVSRQLGLLTRKSLDWHAVEEITTHLRKFNPDDPIRYDYALFGIGIGLYKF
ncbi:MAG: TIGR02757 family protein [Saprospiraceae bacterium]